MTKELIEEGANLFPKYKGKPLKWKSQRSFNRDSVVERIGDDIRNEENREYAKYVKKHPKFNDSMENARDYWRANIRDKSGDVAKKEAYTKRFIDEYSNAILEDLEMDITPQSKQYVEELLRKNQVYKGIV